MALVTSVWKIVVGRHEMTEFLVITERRIPRNRELNMFQLATISVNNTVQNRNDIFHRQTDISGSSAKLMSVTKTQVNSFQDSRTTKWV
jgi:hypothetical protein